MNQDRRERIVQIVNEKSTISNDEIMSSFGVSIETVRRDLAYLEKRGLVERVYGGAVKKKFLSVEPKYLRREDVNVAEKEVIATKAETLINENDTVFFDLGTTVQLLAKKVNQSKQITAFTNSLRTAIALVDKDQKVIVPGGALRSGEYSVSGSIAEDCMSAFNVDKAFIGAGGITEEGITDFDIEEARLRSKVIKNSQKAIVLADYSKIGVRATCNVCGLEHVDVLITDDKAPTEILKNFEKMGVEVIIAKA